jgi:hypothetical protein
VFPICAGPEKIFPTLFGRWRSQRPKAHLAMIHDWQGSAGWWRKDSTVKRGVKRPLQRLRRLIAYWKQHQPDLLFLHLDDVNTCRA